MYWGCSSRPRANESRAGAFPSDRYPHIESWYSVIEELPAWKATAVAPWV